jgi:hypothetical protein
VQPVVAVITQQHPADVGPALLLPPCCSALLNAVLQPVVAVMIQQQL